MKHTTAAATTASLLLATALSICGLSPQAGAAPSTTPVTGRVSVQPGPVEPGSKGASGAARVSGNGRFVTFTSTAGLVAADDNNSDDVYVRDLLTDELDLVSVETDGTSAVSPSYAGAISADGRYVAFYSLSNKLVAGDANGWLDVFVRDRKTAKTELVSISSAGVQGSKASPSSWEASNVDVSDDGRFVAFTSLAPEFSNTPASSSDVYVRDRTTKMTELVSLSSDEVAPNNGSNQVTISSTGRFVAFSSNATNLAPDTNATTGDVFLRDRQAGTTALVSKTSTGIQSTYGTGSPSISDDGTKIAMLNNGFFGPGDQATASDVFVRNTTAGTLFKASTDTGGGEADHNASAPAISGDGSTVAWHSLSGEYVNGGGNGKVHVFKRVGTNPITRESVSTGSAMGDGDSTMGSLSKDGKVIVFESLAGNLVAGDTGLRDVFFRRSPEVGPHGSAASFGSAVSKRLAGSPDAAVSARIANGSSPEREVLLLANRPAFAAKRAPLVRLYTAYFKRLPDTAGLAFWLQKRTGGMTLDQVSAKFATSSEFTTKYGNTTSSQFVTLVYTNVFGRSPDGPGLAYWVAKLDGGMSRGTVMTNFSESSEGVRTFRPQVDTALVSVGLLGKIPAKPLADAMVADMKADSSALGVRRLLTSADYTAVQ